MDIIPYAVSLMVLSVFILIQPLSFRLNSTIEAKNATINRLCYTRALSNYKSKIGR